MHHQIPRASSSPGSRPAATRPATPGAAAPLAAATKSGSATSALAVVSLILGAISPIMICAAFTSLLTATAAIVTGHIAQVRIRRSAGALTGRGFCLAGLVLGYLSLLVTVLVLAGIYFRLSGRDSTEPVAVGSHLPGAAALAAAERAVTSDNDGYALGNSAEARELARQFADEMETLDQALFTQTDAVFKLSGGHYVTWCELRDDQCAFVVHVPEYRKFEQDAKEALAHLAWGAAQRAVAGRLEPGNDLAVGLKGVVLYGAVMVGQVEHEDEDSGERLFEEGDDKSQLYPFFIAELAAPATAPFEADPDPITPESHTPTDPLPLASGDPAAATPPGIPPADFPPFPPPRFPVPPDLTPPPVPPSQQQSPRSSRGKIVPETVAEAAEFLKGDDEARQQQAVSFLAYREFEGPDADVADALFDYLETSADGDRFAAASALRKWASADDLPRLALLLEDENVLVQTHVAESIGLLGTTEAAEVLAARLTDQRSASRVYFPLRKMGQVAEQPVLAVLANSELDRPTLSQVIHILGEIGGQESLAALQRIAGDQDHPGRLIARSAGRRIERRLAE